MLNEHNTVFARSGPLYATGVTLAGQPELSTQTASRSLQSFLQGSLGDIPRYSVGNSRRIAQAYGPIFLRGAESILPEKSGAIWQFFRPKDCQIARKNHFARPWGCCSPPAHTPLAERTVQKPNSANVYGYNKYLLEQSEKFTTFEHNVDR